MFRHYEFMLNANDIEIDYTQSFFCGDAAGRKASKGKKKDYGQSMLLLCRPGETLTSSLFTRPVHNFSSEMGSRLCRQRRAALHPPRGPSLHLALPSSPSPSVP